MGDISEDDSILSSAFIDTSPSNQNKINFELLKNIFNESLEDLKKLKCYSKTATYTGLQLESILMFFKVPLFSRIKKNEDQFFLSDQSPVPLPIKNTRQTSIDDLNNDLDNLDVDDINVKDDTHLISVDVNSSNNSTSKITKLKSQNDDSIFENEEDQLLNEPIINPDIKKQIKKSLEKYDTNDKNESIMNQNNSNDENEPIINQNNRIDENEPVMVQDNNINDENEPIMDQDVDSKRSNASKINNNNNSQLEIVNNDLIENQENLDSNDTKSLTEDIDNIFTSEIPDMVNVENENLIDSDESIENKSNEEKNLYANNNNNNNNPKFDKFRSLLRQVNRLVESDSESNSIDKKFCNTTNDENELKNDEEIIITKRKKKFMLSDNDNDDRNNEKEDESQENKLKEKPSNNTDSSSTTKSTKNSKKRRKKRKRVILPDTSSSSEEDNVRDCEADDDENENDGDDNDYLNESNTRKRLRKIYSNDSLRNETRFAEKLERERRKRIEEKQKLYNSVTKNLPDKPNEGVDRVVLDIDKNTKEVLVEVDPKFAMVLKPHQIEGIKFLFNSTIETVERLNKNDHQSGCILAHSMGLGKTLQVIVFVHTIMNNPYTKNIIRKVLIIVPLNVALNWTAEFYKWLYECGIENKIQLYEVIKKKNFTERITLLKEWNEKNGIVIITTNLFSKLILAKNLTKKQKNKDLPTLKKYLLDPGPDMVIVDEGHLLKNDKTKFNNCINQIRTLRRIILTGTPLQNNLSEYYIMVNFVKPNLLGSKKEFKNRFENPITNGQHIDSTELDVKLMKKRVHILHKLLQHCIHRCSYSVLVPYLNPKYEYVLNICLTSHQIKLYRHYLDNMTNKCGKNLLLDHSILRLICNHPALLIDYYKRKNEDTEEDSLKAFVISESSESEENENKEVDSDIECIFENKPETEKNQSNTELNDNNGSGNNDWWQQFLNENECLIIELSAKFIILFSILESCEILGDKLLIFSQSLTTLDIIEKMLFLKMKEINQKYGDINYNELIQKTNGISHQWLPNIDYFRIDGRVRCDNRHSIIDKFNDEKDLRARLMLVSTKAGNLGINLVGANRCIIFDVSWNPSNDLQAIYRIFRYGQKKPVYIYRFISYGTMENKIYDRQITKQSMARRVIDEHQITRHFKQSELAELYTLTEGNIENAPLPMLPKDRLLADIFTKHRSLIFSYHEHDSLLENRPEEDLTEEERKAAWAEYELAHENAQLQSPQLQNTQLQKNTFVNNQTNQMFAQTKMNPQMSYLMVPSNLSSTSANFFKNFTSPANYYKTFMEQSALHNRMVSNMQESKAKTFTSISNNDYLMEEYFDQIKRHFSQVQIIHSKYEFCTFEHLANEFTEIFKVKRKCFEWNIKFFCYITFISFYIIKLKEPALENMLNHLEQMRKDFIIKNNLMPYIHIVYFKIRDILETQVFNLPNNVNSFNNDSSNAGKLMKPQSVFKVFNGNMAPSNGSNASANKSQTIECINLDSDDE